MSSVTSIPNNQAASFLNPPEAEIIRDTGKKALNVDDFLHLITVQLTTQDPLKPMEDTQFISQMASFTSLEQMQKLSEDFAEFTAQQKSLGAQDYLGKTVTVATEAGNITGQVTKVSFKDGGAFLSLGGGEFSASDVVSISTTPPASTTATTASTSNPPVTPAAAN